MTLGVTGLGMGLVPPLELTSLNQISGCVTGRRWIYTRPASSPPGHLPTRIEVKTHNDNIVKKRSLLNNIVQPQQD